MFPKNPKKNEGDIVHFVTYSHQHPWFVYMYTYSLIGCSKLIKLICFYLLKLLFYYYVGRNDMINFVYVFDAANAAAVNRSVGVSLNTDSPLTAYGQTGKKCGKKVF